MVYRRDRGGEHLTDTPLQPQSAPPSPTSICSLPCPRRTHTYRPMHFYHSAFFRSAGGRPKEPWNWPGDEGFISKRCCIPRVKSRVSWFLRFPLFPAQKANPGETEKRTKEGSETRERRRGKEKLGRRRRKKAEWRSLSKVVSHCSYTIALKTTSTLSFSRPTYNGSFSVATLKPSTLL